jgi:hypothetical protein
VYGDGMISSSARLGTTTGSGIGRGWLAAEMLCSLLLAFEWCVGLCLCYYLAGCYSVARSWLVFLSLPFVSLLSPPSTTIKLSLRAVSFASPFSALIACLLAIAPGVRAAARS